MENVSRNTHGHIKAQIQFKGNDHDTTQHLGHFLYKLTAMIFSSILRSRRFHILSGIGKSVGTTS